MKRVVGLLTVLLLIAGGCKEKKGTLTLHVKGRFGNEDLALYQEYTLTDGKKMKLSTVKFYLSNIQLIRDDGMAFDLKKVMLVDLANTASLSYNAGEMNQSFIGIRFDVGLDSVTNETNPNSVPSTDPLSDQDMYWTWIKYVFYKFQGYADLNGGSAFNTLLLYHVGANSNHHTRQINFLSLPTDPEGNIDLHLVFDMKKVFEAGSNSIDLATESVTHTDDDPNLAAKIALNFANSFVVE